MTSAIADTDCAAVPQMERRERLRKLMAAMDEDTVADAFEALGPGFSVAEQAPTKEIFYTEGPETLLDARMQARRRPFCTATPGQPMYSCLITPMLHAHPYPVWRK